MNTLLQKLGDIESNFDKELRELVCRIEKCEKLGAENSKQLKQLDKKFSTELSNIITRKKKRSRMFLMLQKETSIFLGELENFANWKVW